MKNHAFFISLCFVFFCNATNAQRGFSHFNMKKHAVTAAPWQAFTDRSELQFGFEKQNSRHSSIELNAGFRFAGSADPGLSPYYLQNHLGTSYREVRKGVQFLLFIPIPVSGRDDSWEEKTTRTETYTTHHVFASVAVKQYLLPLRKTKVPGGLYLAPGIRLGNRSTATYTFTEGQRGDVTTLESDFLPNGEIHPVAILLGTGFIGTHKVVQEDLYEFSSLTKKEDTKTYFHPTLRLGFQAPIGKLISLDLGGQMTIEKFPIGKTRRSPFGFEPVARAGVWF